MRTVTPLATARALGEIGPAQLSDPTLFDFRALGRDGNAAWPGGDNGVA